MSASFSLKMMRIRIAVIETGSIRGNVTSQNERQPVAPSTRDASVSSLGIACNPASSMIIMKGMNVQASISMMVARATSGVPKKEGLSQPSQRARRARGPNRASSIDLPTIQLTATGDSIRGRRNATRKNLRPRICELSRRARPKAIAYSTTMARVYQTMLVIAFQ